jgi:predicted transcriptional regulator of viral defense system
VNSTPVSRREAEVVEAVTSRDLVVFGPREVERFIDVSSRNAYRILHNMREKGLVQRLARGTYVLSETYETLDSYAVASHLEPVSYVGFWSALHYHSMTEQVPRTVFVAVTKQKRSIRVQGQDVRFVRVKPETFFGYDRYGDAVVSDPEKTVLDCLRLPDHAGGVRHVSDALDDDLDVDRLVRYAERLGSGAVAARVGYLLEQKGLLDGRDRLRELVTSYTKLDPANDRTNPVAAWKLYANVTLDDRPNATS